MQQQANCHPDRPVEARGLCHTCYERARKRGLLAGFPRRAAIEDRRLYWRQKKREYRRLDKATDGSIITT